MPLVLFDTQESCNRLKRAGLSETMAEALVEELKLAFEARVEVKELLEEIRALRNELREARKK